MNILAAKDSSFYLDLLVLKVENKKNRMIAHPVHSLFAKN